jgi:fermentation-respiration switch protein FrsA (DUF1100 family)
MRKPVLVVHSEQALLPSLAHRFFAGLGGKKEELWLKSVGQIDFYDDPKLIDLAADEAAEWFSRHR